MEFRENSKAAFPGSHQEDVLVNGLSELQSRALQIKYGASHTPCYISPRAASECKRKQVNLISIICLLNLMSIPLLSSASGGLLAIFGIPWHVEASS